MGMGCFLLLIVVMAISNAYATEVYSDYDSAFDTSTSIVLEYNITPSISSDDLVEWVHNQGSDRSWVYHTYQDAIGGSFRYEVGYWIWKDNTSKFVISLYGNTSEGEVSRVNVVFDLFKMQSGKTYNIKISINGSKLEFFINGEKYAGPGHLQVWYANGSFNGWVPFNNGDISLGNFSLRQGIHGIKWGVTGWDSEHLGSHPFEDFIIANAMKYSVKPTPIKSPIPYEVVVLSFIAMTIVVLMGDDIWIRKC
ncbi:hypothetical protein [Methanotorris formicicus]|nr:hypothetical protein [Methanotorris formicicus]